MYALIWLAIIAGTPQAPKSIVVYATVAKCESALKDMRSFAGSTVLQQQSDGSFKRIPVKNSFTCVPAYWESR